jgi:uncharacterized membrane protein YqgA involved in biofilm formation
MIGTLINVGTVVAGASVGLLVRKRIPDRIHETVFKGLGLLTLVIGVKMSLETNNVLVLVASTLSGGLVGKWVGIQRCLDRLGNYFQARIGEGRGRFSEAFVTSSLVFCVGPMTILGSIQDGLTGDYTLLTMKSMLDAFSSMAFSATLGAGVLLSALTVFLFQGGLTLSASLLDGQLTEPMVAEITACGGVMLLGIGLVLLDVIRPRVANFLPSLLIAPLIMRLEMVLA